MSLRKSINAFCKECIHDPGQPGSWLLQVTECQSRDCPLYGVRPLSKSVVKTPLLERMGLVDPDHRVDVDRSMALV